MIGSDVCWRRAPNQIIPRCQVFGLAHQGQVMWKRIKSFCKGRGTVAPSVWVMFGDSRATPAVFFLRGTRVGMMVSSAPRGMSGGGREMKSGTMERRGAVYALQCNFSFVFPLSIFLCPIFFSGASWK